MDRRPSLRKTEPHSAGLRGGRVLGQSRLPSRSEASSVWGHASPCRTDHEGRPKLGRGPHLLLYLLPLTRIRQRSPAAWGGLRDSPVSVVRAWTRSSRDMCYLGGSSVGVMGPKVVRRPDRRSVQPWSGWQGTRG